jgi:hypothetical protein
VVLLASVVHRLAGTGADSSATQGTIGGLPPSAAAFAALFPELQPHVQEANDSRATTANPGERRFMTQIVVESFPGRKAASLASAGYCGGGCDRLQTLLTQVTPCAAPQQSLVVEHFSYWPEHEGICDEQTRPPPSPGWQ